MPTFRSTRKGKKCFFVMSLRLSNHKVLHNIASSSRFFRFRSDFHAFFARISFFKFLEFKEFNKTIIPFALVIAISYPTLKKFTSAHLFQIAREKSFDYLLIIDMKKFL